MTNFAEPFETERLALYPLAPEHSEHLLTLISDAQHTRYLSIPTTTCAATMRTMTEEMVRQPRNCLWLLKEKGTSEFAGMCGLMSDSAVPNCVYSIAETKKNRGYAYEAAVAAISRGRTLLAIDEVELNIHSGNAASLRVAAKLGFAKVKEYEFSYPQTGRSTVFVFRRRF